MTEIKKTLQEQTYLNKAEGFYAEFPENQVQPTRIHLKKNRFKRQKILFQITKKKQVLPSRNHRSNRKFRVDPASSRGTIRQQGHSSCFGSLHRSNVFIKEKMLCFLHNFSFLFQDEKYRGNVQVIRVDQSSQYKPKVEELVNVLPGINFVFFLFPRKR